MKNKYMINALQAEVIMNGLGAGLYNEIINYGHVQWCGIAQEPDGEIFISVYYVIGSMTGMPPAEYMGFKLKPVERRNPSYFL